MYSEICNGFGYRINLRFLIFQLINYENFCDGQGCVSILVVRQTNFQVRRCYRGVFHVTGDSKWNMAMCVGVNEK